MKYEKSKKKIVIHTRERRTKKENNRNKNKCEKVGKEGPKKDDRKKLKERNKKDKVSHRINTPYEKKKKDTLHQQQKRSCISLPLKFPPYITEENPRKRNTIHFTRQKKRGRKGRRKREVILYNIRSRKKTKG